MPMSSAFMNLVGMDFGISDVYKLYNIGHSVELCKHGIPLRMFSVRLDPERYLS